jgi:hypothetical protein
MKWLEDFWKGWDNAVNGAKDFGQGWNDFWTHVSDTITTLSDPGWWNELVFTSTSITCVFLYLLYIVTSSKKPLKLMGLVILLYVLFRSVMLCF